MLPADVSPYAKVVGTQFDAIIKERMPDASVRCWDIVVNQKSAADVYIASKSFFERFQSQNKPVVLKFSDGLVEAFNLTTVEALKKESKTVERAVNRGETLALSRSEFKNAVCGYGEVSLEVAYYLGIPRQIEKAERDIREKVKSWIHTSNVLEGLRLLKEIKGSLLRNNPFCVSLVENELATLFGNGLIIRRDTPLLLQYIELYKAAGVTALSLSFESDLSVRCLPLIGQIDSIKTLVIDSFSLNEGVLVFPKNLVRIDFINTTNLSGTTLKALPSTVKSIAIDCTGFKNDDLKYLPQNIVYLTINCTNRPLSADKLPSTLRILELSNSLAVTDEWLRNLPQLEALYIENCSNITGKTLKLIPRSIKVLEIISCSQLEDDDLSSLPPELEELSVAKCSKITNRSMKLLPPTLLRLDVSDTEVDDQGLLSLNTELEELDISGCRISGECFEHLPQLIILRVNSPNISTIQKEYISKIPKSVVVLEIAADLSDKELIELPPSLNHVSITSLHLTNEGLLNLTRTLTEVYLVATNTLTERAKDYLPGNCTLHLYEG